MIRAPLHPRNSSVKEILESLHASYILNFDAHRNSTTKRLLALARDVFDFGGFFTENEPDALTKDQLDKLGDMATAAKRVVAMTSVQVYVHRHAAMVSVVMVAAGHVKTADGSAALVIITLESTRNGRWVGLGHYLFRLEDETFATVHVDRKKEVGLAKRALRAVFGMVNFLHLEGPLRYRADNPLPRPVKPASEKTDPPKEERPPREESVLVVNRPRVIGVNGRPKAEPTGQVRAPHDRDGCWVTSKLGKRFWRKAAKIHGGAPADKPRIRRVVLAAPITKET